MAITQDTPGELGPGAQELVEGADGTGPRAIPVAVEPVSRIRSPILEHRSFEPLPADEYRPGFLLPPLQAFIGPSRFALLVALPLLVLVTWQVALVGAVGATLARELHGRTNRMTFSFGEGFLPYRPDTGWPQGVQEDDEVLWQWTPIDNRGGATG